MADQKRSGRSRHRRRTPAIPLIRVEREFSCGGVVLLGDDCLLIQPNRPDGRVVWTLPKGHPEGEEDPPTAAIREIFEETGVSARVTLRLGDIVYWYQRDGRRIRKTVRMYLCEHVEGEAAGDGREVIETRWVPLKEAAKMVSFPGDREMVKRALARHRGDR